MTAEEALGRRIARIRHRRGWSQMDLAAKMQARGHSTLSDKRINEIENGYRRVTSDEVISFAAVLGVTVPELLQVPADKPPPLD